MDLEINPQWIDNPRLYVNPMLRPTTLGEMGWWNSN